MRLFSIIWKIVLGGITGFCILGVFGIMMSKNDDLTYYRTGVVELTDFSVKKIEPGEMKEPAKEGYQYYRAELEAENISHFSEEESHVWRYYDGAEYGDVELLDERRSDIFGYANERILPAGKKTVIEDLLMIRDGTREITIIYRNGEEDKEHKIIVPVPES